MKKILLILSTILTCYTSYCQPLNDMKNIIHEGKYACLLGYNYNRLHAADLGIVKGWSYNYTGAETSMVAGEFLYPYSYFSLSSEFLYDKNLILCPKLGYHYVWSLIDVGINVFNYTDFSNNSAGIRPEVGLSLSGVFGVTYGYSFRTNHNIFNLSNHNLSVRMILGTGLFK